MRRVIESDPASFEAFSLLATGGSCFNDGKFKICSLEVGQLNRRITGSHLNNN